MKRKSQGEKTSVELNFPEMVLINRNI